MTADVVVIGGASMNTIVELDRLPEPRPHTVMARGHRVALGGTSAGKALHLAALGTRTVLVTVTGHDELGAHILAALDDENLETIALAGDGASERHLNLMAPGGARLSIYLDQAPSAAPTPAQERAIFDAVSSARVIAVDLSDLGLAWIDRAATADGLVSVDLHDYDGANPYHDPYIAAADLVFMNNDGLADPIPFLRGVVSGGARLAVCTLGARGAIAVAGDRELVEVAAAPTVVVDTNGAGDAFAAGVIHSLLGAASPGGIGDVDATVARNALSSGAARAAAALRVHGVGPARAASM